MTLPTFSSVTDKPCTCRHLEEAADDPDMPIQYDATTGEFQFTYDDQSLTRWQYLQIALGGAVRPPRATLILYHCPFCGGCAPTSKRDLLFEVISREEESRLAGLLSNIKTIDDALKQLGPPDMNSHIALKARESDSRPSTIEHRRLIQYQHLSPVANVEFTERPDGCVFWQLQGKPKR